MTSVVTFAVNRIPPSQSYRKRRSILTPGIRCSQVSPKNTSLLLDFDGVIYHDKVALDMVQARAVDFVRERLDGKVFDAGTIDADAVNTFLYKKYGHTVLGLNAHFNLQITMNEFNDYLYSQELFNDIRKKNLVQPRNNNAMYRGECAKVLTDHARRAGLGVYVFTNAPKRWVMFALGELSLHGLFRYWEVISAEDYETNKPDPQIYKEVHQDLGFYHNLLFVDDSAINVKNAPKNWKSYHMDVNSKQSYDTPTGNDSRTINNLLELVYNVDMY